MGSKIDDLIEQHRYTGELRGLGYTDNDLGLIQLVVHDEQYLDDPDYELLKQMPDIWSVLFSRRVTAETRELEIAYGRMKWAMSSTSENEAYQRQIIWKELSNYDQQRSLSQRIDSNSKGALIRAARYDPLIKLAVDLVKEKNPPYPSRRQAALGVADRVIAMSKEIGVNLSEQQSEKTISKWLKDAGITF